jgi:hypothetical protein
VPFHAICCLTNQNPVSQSRDTVQYNVLRYLPAISLLLLQLPVIIPSPHHPSTKDPRPPRRSFIFNLQQPSQSIIVDLSCISSISAVVYSRSFSSNIPVQYPHLFTPQYIHLDCAALSVLLCAFNRRARQPKRNTKHSARETRDNTNSAPQCRWTRT